LRRFSWPEFNHSWVEAQSRPRRIKSISPLIRGPGCRRLRPGSRGTQTTGVQIQQESRRIIPNRRAPSLSRPDPTGSTWLRPFRARRCPSTKVAANRSDTDQYPLDKVQGRPIMDGAAPPRCPARISVTARRIDGSPRGLLRRLGSKDGWPSGVGFFGSWIQAAGDHRRHHAEIVFGARKLRMDTLADLAP
jgi:hypothetical protein